MSSKIVLQFFIFRFSDIFSATGGPVSIDIAAAIRVGEHNTTGLVFRYQDNHSRAWILLQSSMRWMYVRVEFSCALFVFVVFYASVATQSGPGTYEARYSVCSVLMV